MAKKLSLSDLTNLTKKQEGIAEVISKDDFTPPPIAEDLLPIIGFYYFAEGREQTALYCHGCGHSWNVNYRTYGGYSSMMECPQCGSKKRRRFINVRGILRTNQNFAYVREVNKADGYAIIDVIKYEYKHDCNGCDEIFNDGKLEFLKGNFTPSIYVSDEFIFSTNFGIRTFSYLNCTCATVIESLNTNAYREKTSNYSRLAYVKNENYNSFIEMINESFPDAISDENTNIAYAITTLSEDILNSRRRTSQSGTTKTKSAKKDPYIDAVLREITIDDIKDNSTSLLSLHYETFNRVQKYRHYCPNCKSVFDGEYPDTTRYYNLGAITCPHCQTVYDKNHNSKEGTACTEGNNYLFVDRIPETDEMVVRYFNFRVILKYDGTVEKYVKEYKRVFLSKKHVVVVEDLDGKGWIKPKRNPTGLSAAPSNERYGYTKANLINSLEELKETILQTDFKYSGLLEAWGLIESPIGLDKMEEPGTIHNSSYLSVFLKAPYIEQVYKTGLVRAAKDIMNGYGVPNMEGTDVYSILGIGKPVFKMARQINANLAEIKVLNDFWKSDNTFDINIYQRIADLGLKNHYSKLISIRTEYNIKYQDQIEYLKNCYDHQCIYHSSALDIWYDYLNMASKMKYRLNDAGHKYPQSLKKEHDRAQFSFKVVADQINHQKFIDQAEINAAYEYEGEEYFVKVPREPNEVIQEGTSLKHCVASYVENIRSGKTVVCFIRKKDEPDVSYFTSEVLDGTIVQVKGYTNSLPTEKSLLDFVDEWAKARDLEVGRHF